VSVAGSLALSIVNVQTSALIGSGAAVTTAGNVLLSATSTSDSTATATAGATGSGVAPWSR